MDRIGNGMEWNGMEWKNRMEGMEWNGMEWNGMEWWNGTKTKRNSYDVRTSHPWSWDRKLLLVSKKPIISRQMRHKASHRFRHSRPWCRTASPPAPHISHRRDRCRHGVPADPPPPGAEAGRPPGRELPDHGELLTVPRIACRPRDLCRAWIRWAGSAIFVVKVDHAAIDAGCRVSLNRAPCFSKAL